MQANIPSVTSPKRMAAISKIRNGPAITQETSDDFSAIDTGGNITLGKNET